MKERFFSVDPNEVDKYRSKVNDRFERWHKEEWFFLDDEQFREISSASFLAYLGYIIDSSDPDGRIDLEMLQGTLQEKLG